LPTVLRLMVKRPSRTETQIVLHNCHSFGAVQDRSGQYTHPDLPWPRRNGRRLTAERMREMVNGRITRLQKVGKLVQKGDYLVVART
jgi:hypothetical protein